MIQLKIPQIFTQSKSAYFPFVKMSDFGKISNTKSIPKTKPQITDR